MKLVIWTASKDQQAINRTIGEGIRQLPEKIEHRVQPLIEGDLYVPGPDEIVLACGKRALELLAGAKLCPKNRAMDSIRGQVLQASIQQGRYLLTLDPGMVNIDIDAILQIGWDIRLAYRLMKTGKLDAVLGKYRWVDNLGDAINCIKEKHAQTGKPVAVALDTETMGKFPWYFPDKRILTIQISHTEGFSDVYKVPSDGILPPNLQAHLTWLLNAQEVRIRGANLKFDLVWIAVHWQIECTNFTMDTTAVGSLLNENRSNSLDVHVKTYDALLGGYADAFNNKYDKGHMELVPDDDMLPYAGGDTDGALRVSNRMIPELMSDPQLFHFYTTVRHPALRAFEKVERRGILVDIPKFVELGDELSGVIKELKKEALDLLPGKIKIKYLDNLSLSRSAVLRDYFFGPNGLNLKPQMFTEKSGEPSTAKAHLQMFAQDERAKDMCRLLKELGSAEKTYGTYVGSCTEDILESKEPKGFLADLRPDGRWHPSYILFKGAMYDDVNEDPSGTVTTRLAAKNPAAQTIPSKTKWAKKIRACIIAPEGQVLFTSDYAQGELKLAADRADEKVMLQVYLDGHDLHSKTAAGTMGISLQEFIALEKSDPVLHKQMRTAGKSQNFGLLYGISVDGYITYCWVAFEVVKTKAEGEKEHEGFFNTYPALKPWHQKDKAFARQHGFIRSPLGVVRHLPLIHSKDNYERGKAERQSINAPIQSTLSNMNEWAIARIEQELGTSDSGPIAAIHDQIVGYCPVKGAETYAKDVVEIMENLPFEKEFGWKPKLRFTVDMELGLNLASLKPPSKFLQSIAA